MKLQVKNFILHLNLNFQDYKARAHLYYYFPKHIYLRFFQVLELFFKAIRMDFLFSNNLFIVKYNFMAILNLHFGQN